jgi:Uma2 family endonuclease
MSSAHRYLPNYTVKDYRSWEGDWELWQGVPVSMSPSPFGRHQQIAMRLATLLQNAIDGSQCDAVVLAEIDWIVSNDMVVRPDVLVHCGDAPLGHVEHPPAFIAEVLSPSTKERDETAKHNLYQDEGVKYYWILDPDQSLLIAFELSKQGIYEQQSIDDGLVLDVCDDCELRLQVSRLFR